MKRFEFDELLNKDKEELEKIKTAIDIHTYSAKQEIEKRKYTSDNLKAFGLALFTATITLGSTFIIKSFEKCANDKSDLIKEFNSLKKQIILAEGKEKVNLCCYVANEFENTSDINEIKLFKKSCDTICLKNDIIENKKTTVALFTDDSTNLSKNKSALTLLSKNEQEINSLQLKKAIDPTLNIDKRIQVLNNETETIIAKNPDLKKAVDATAILDDNIVTTNKIIAETNNSLGSKNKTYSSWFKEGYFLQFDDIRILLQYLDKDIGIEVQVCNTTSSDICKQPLKNKAWIKKDKPLVFSVENKEYKIELNNIDHAGKNPFTLAAYITMSIN